MDKIKWYNLRMEQRDEIRRSDDWKYWNEVSLSELLWYRERYMNPAGMWFERWMGVVPDGYFAKKGI